MDNQPQTLNYRSIDPKSAQTTTTDISSPVLDPIAEALDLTPVLPKEAEVDVSSISDDFEYARGNMISVIEKGQEALSGILDVAGMSQQPRAYEVAASLLKAVADANKDLLDLSKRKKELLKQDETKGPSTVNNNMFVGNAAELLKMIKSNGV